MNDKVVIAEHITKIFSKNYRKSLFADFRKLIFPEKQKDDYEEKVVAIDDLSFELKKGEMLGIIGNNGAGKSTLLKILSGITLTTSCKATIYGTVASFLDISSTLVPELTGKENIFIIGKFQGLSTQDIHQLYNDIAEFSELGDYLNTPVKYYSSGMVMRLAFSVMIHCEKDIYLFDEIFSVGDIFFRAKCHKLLFKLKNKGCSMILVSHNLNELATICDRISLLHEGKIVAIGRLEDVVKLYNNYNYGVDKNSPKRKKLLQQSKSGDEDVNTKKKHWTAENAPGDDTCSILGAELLGFPDSTSTDMKEVRLKIHARFSGFTGEVSFIVSDILDHKLFGDTSASHKDIVTELSYTGDFDLIWDIPLSRLNHGIYKISLQILDTDHNIRFKIINPLIFEVLHPEETDFVLYTPLKMDMKFNMHPCK
ncbi:MAG: ATP-binding cassette domain-containing protein [Bacteroidota bacterium]